MKFLTVACLAFIILNAKTCNLKVNTSPKISVKEDELLNAVKDTFQAESVKVMRVEDDDSIVERSLQVTLLNCKRINLDDPQLKYYGGLIADSLLAKSDFEKRYDEIEIAFEQKTGNWFYNKSKSVSFVFKQPQMDEMIDRNLGHGTMLLRRINMLQKNKRFMELILIGDSLIKTDSSLACLGQQARGIGYLNSGDSIKALKCFLLARQAEPGNAANYENLALVYHNMKNNRLAQYGNSNGAAKWRVSLFKRYVLS